ncbi:NAD(P)-dependent oxidoreductase [Rhizobium sp. CF142]|uniref:NAD(P)-dependent oxidoreductase n=1 Tax=Rhizobium sp. CF142 TaxID=1144314 RepID=UPI00026F0506|nr:NAD(P)-dependent oxidoreductase [Rhizobium sp. CF142]EJJ25575.1 beta-hydroxyacid dehydrogenase, 3-hydroxyisobutyrate dehydrogenase [Rhizobium sp. CF142]
MKIGFIGLGTMGRGMAGNLRKAGYEMVLHDLRREAAEPFLGERVFWAETARQVAAECDVVFTSLPKPEDVEAICFGSNGLNAGFKAGAAWFDLSTNSVDLVKSLNGRLCERGVDFLDAPVSGGPAGAASGKLAIWVGGSRVTFDRCLGPLTSMADQTRYIGDIGAGTVAKLVHNVASATITQVLAETMTVGVKAGLDPLELYEAIRGGALGRMRSFDLIARRWLADRLDPPSFELQLQHKDVKLGVELARSLAVPTRLCNLALEELTEAMNRGWSKRDSQSVLHLQQERAGLERFAIPLEKIEDVLNRT